MTRPIKVAPGANSGAKPITQTKPNKPNSRKPKRGRPTNGRTPTATPTAIQKEQKETDPLVRTIGKLILGLGLAGLVLWLNPMGLTDLLMTFGIPLILIVLLLISLGLVGSGTLELLKGRTLGERVQAYVRQERACPVP